MSTYKHEIRPADEAGAGVGVIRHVPRYSQLIGRRCEVPETSERGAIITKMLNYRQPKRLKAGAR